MASGRTHIGRWLASAAATAVMLLVPIPARADAPQLSLRGCTETFVLVGGDEQAIRAAVPERYTLGAEPPVGDLWLVSHACRSVSVGGSDAGAATVSFVGAAVQAPDGGSGDGITAPAPYHSYLFWAATNSAAVARALGAAGFPAVFAPATRQTLTEGVLQRHALLEVDLPDSPYRIATATTPLTTHPHSHDAYWWFDGQGGPRHVLVHQAFSTENISDCGVSTTPGSRLAALLGTSDSPTACFMQGPVDSTAQF